MKEIQQPFSTPIFFFLFSLTYTTYPSFSLHPYFTACAPVSCTPTGPSIAFPFWVAGRQPPYCGSHGFRTTCSRGTPILSFSGDHYAIKSIHPENQSILVVNSAVLKQKTCPTPLRNLSLELTPFTFPPSHYSFSIFYNCTSLPDFYKFLEYKCASNGSHHSFAVFHEGMLLANVSSQACLETVSVPMDLDYGAVQTMIGMEFGNLSEIMERGFLLRWTAPSCVNCSVSGGRCGFDGTTFVCFCRDRISTDICSAVVAAAKRNWGLKAGIASSAAVLGVVTMCLVFYLHHRRGGKPASSGWSFRRRMVSGRRWGECEKGGAGIYIFSYNELEEATHKFSPGMELGDGGFGAVYKGKLRDGRCVAVKRLYESNYKRVEQFMNEVEILTRLRHPNLVFLYGCTSRHCRELLLVYEYVANGTLAEHLHGLRPGLLPWAVRLTIAAETASALSYLHSSGIVHRDVKTTNILLGDDLSVKVADFGLSRLFPADVSHVSTAPQGTPGYVDPDYHQCYQLTDRSDVYSYGVVLVELISAKPAVDITRKREEINLSTMATNKIRNGAVDELVDPRLGLDDAGWRVREEVTGMAELAFRCLQVDKDMRPSMDEVVECLAVIRGCPSKQAHVVTAMTTRLLPSPDSLTLSWNSHLTTPNTSAN